MLWSPNLEVFFLPQGQLMLKKSDRQCLLTILGGLYLELPIYEYVALSIYSYIDSTSATHFLTRQVYLPACYISLGGREGT